MSQVGLSNDKCKSPVNVRSVVKISPEAGGSNTNLEPISHVSVHSLIKCSIFVSREFITFMSVSWSRVRGRKSKLIVR